MLKKSILGINFAFIAFVVIYLYATGGPIPGGHFPEEGTYLLSEGKIGTLYSAIQILLVGLTALALFFKSIFASKKQEYLFWLLSFIGFTFLSLDEYFLIHENIDKWIIKTFGLPENRVTDRIDDVLVLIYGLFGLYILKKSWPWLKTYRGFISNIKIAFVLLFLMVLFDIAHIKFTPVRELEEDSLKLLSAGFFLISYLSCFQKNEK